MARTIDTSGTVGITLTAGDNLVTIAPTGTIDTTAAGSYALYGPSPTAFTIVNSGFVRDSVSTGMGIGLKNGGALTNALGGLVSGNSIGVIAGGPATIANYGTIRAFGAGVSLTAGGSVTNASGALLYGISQGVYARNTPATVTNSGNINGGAGTGVRLLAGGTVINNAGGFINSHLTSVYIRGGAGTVVNAGSIYSVSLPGGYTNELDLSPGAKFGSTVDGGNKIGAGATTSLVLLSAASAGKISNVTNFGSVVFAPGASWTFSGNTSAVAGGEVFSGFAAGDTINIRAVTNETIAGFANNTLSLTGGVNLNVVIPGNFTASSFKVANGPTLYGVINTTDITLAPACFAAGTRIQAEAGEIAVEDLREGDRVLAHFGRGTVPIVWIGRRHVRFAGNPAQERARPILIRAGAFGTGRPHSDLRLSPDHAVFVDGVLVPIRLLVNGATIVQATVSEVVYYHVELPEHDIIQAEGLSCESYLNTGNRSAFENGSGAVLLHPDFSPLWREARTCAELVSHGPRLDRIRATLSAEVAGVTSGRVLASRTG